MCKVGRLEKIDEFSNGYRISMPKSDRDLFRIRAIGGPSEEDFKAGLILEYLLRNERPVH